MRRSMTLVGALMALLVALPNHTEAQDRPQTREGFFISLGLGVGSFDCSECNARQRGGAAQLTLGSAIRPNVLIGAQSVGWTKSEGGDRVTHGNIMAIVQFYPAVASGLFLKGGVGISRLTTSSDGGAFSFNTSDNGLGLTAGLGYDFRLGTNFSLGPYGSFAWGNFDGGTANHFQGGLSATLH